MKFESLSEIQLLKLCLQTKRAQLIPRIFDYKTRLERTFTPESVELLADISEEYHTAHINGKRPTAETIATYQKFIKIAREHGDDVVDLVAAFRKTIINYQEFDRIINLNTDAERIETIQEYRQNPDAAPTQTLVDFSESMTKNAPGRIADRYILTLNAMKENAKQNRYVDDSYIERISTFQQHLRTIYPTTIRAPQKKPTLTNNPLLNDIKQGVPVDLAIANASKSCVGRQTLAKLIATGILIPAALVTVIGLAQSAPTNSSHYNDFYKTGTVGHLFPEDTKEQIFRLGTRLTDYRENELPTNEEFSDFINTIDAFYSNTIKNVLTNSYNEYADETGKPRAISVKFEYNDYNGNNNILRITDESGKTYDVSTNTNGVFEHNTIGVIYNAERQIDNYRERFDASKSVSMKIDLLDKINDDFYDVLDALTLDYTFEEAGIVSKIFGTELVLTESSQEKEIKDKGPVDHIQAVEAPEIDDDDAR